MKKAVILFRHMDAEYCNRFIKQLLKDGTTEIFVHVNARAEHLKEKMIKLDRVHMIKNNVSIDWGGYGLLLAIIQSWKEVLDYGNYNYIILCSGQDILLKTGLDEFLKNHPKRIFIDSYEDDRNRRVFFLNRWPSVYMRNIEHKYNIIRMIRRLRIELIKHGFSFWKRKVPFCTDDMIFYKNYFWSDIPSEAVQWIINYIAEYPDYLEVFKGPDAEEGFIVTTLMRSPYKAWIKYRNGTSSSLTFIKPYRNNHPQILDTEDIQAAEDSGMFFARKIHTVKSAEFIEYFYKDKKD